MAGHTHIVKKCQYGYTHGQCRCMSKDKIEERVMCDNPSHIPADWEDRLNNGTRVYGLESAGKQLKDAEEAREKAMALIKARAIDANKSGMSKTQIANLTGVSRQTIYTMLTEG